MTRFAQGPTSQEKAAQLSSMFSGGPELQLTRPDLTAASFLASRGKNSRAATRGAGRGLLCCALSLSAFLGFSQPALASLEQGIEVVGSFLDRSPGCGG